MISLIQNEWMKIFQKKSTYAFLIFLIVLAFGSAILDKKMTDGDSKKDWKQEIQTENEGYQAELANQKVSDEDKAYYTEEIERNNQLLKENINPNLNTTWTFLTDWATSLMSFITLFAVIVSSSMVSSEFSDGTIKQLLIRPYKRWKILLSKYLTSLLFSLLLLVVLLAASFLAGAIFFDFGSYSDRILNSEAIEFSTVVVGNYFLKMVLYWLPGFLVIITIAFMLSTLFKSQAIAVGIAIALLFASSTLNIIIQSFVDDYSWLKLLIFPHLDLRAYVSQAYPIFEGATFGTSLTTLAVYYVIFMVVTFFFFQKKDITY